MRAIFLASKQPANAVAKWAASLQTSVRHVTAWFGAGDLGRRQNSSACNADAFLLGPDTTLESHVAQYFSGEGLLLVSLEPSQQTLPRSGVVLLIWQPQVPQDIVQACSVLVDGGNIRGLLLVDASPSLTLSVTHKALEGAGLCALARKPTVLATRTVQAPHAAVQALQQLAETLPPITAVPVLPSAPGGVRIAIARDDTFGPCFHENLTLLHQSGAHLMFFSPLYDAALPAGATCLYLSSGPLEPERWQQLAANKPLLAAVRAFCEAGGLVLAEGAGLLYLARTVDVNEDGDGNKNCVHNMAGVLPFKTRLLVEAQNASVEVLVTPGNPLLPAGSRLRGYLSAQASIFMVEERQLQILVGNIAAGLGNAEATSPRPSTTYEVTVVQQLPQSRATHKLVGDSGAPAPLPSAEGYTLHNVLGSSCLLFFPSDPGFVGHLLHRCACLDPAVLAASMAQHVGGSMVAAVGKMHYHSVLGSTACSCVGSRRQSIQDVSALAAAHASNGSISAGSSCGMLAGLAGYSAHPNTQHLQQQHLHVQIHHHQQHQCHLPGTQHQTQVNPSLASCCLGYSQGVGNDCAGICTSTGRTLSHSNSAIGASLLGPAPQPLSRLESRVPVGTLNDSGQVYTTSHNPNPHGHTPHAPTLVEKHPGHSALAPSGRPDIVTTEQQESGQKYVDGLKVCGSGVSIVSYANASASVDQDAMQCKLGVTGNDCEKVVSATTSDTSSHLQMDETMCAEVCACEGAQKCTAAEREISYAPCNTVGELPTGMMHPITSAGAFTRCGSVGSSCSLTDLRHQQYHYKSRLGEQVPIFGPSFGLDYAAARWGPSVNTVGASAGGNTAQGWSPGILPPGPHQGPAILVGTLGAAHATVHGGVVCCAPGACEALVEMGLTNRLAGIGGDCDHPANVCTSRRVVLNWVPPEEAPQGAAARGIRVVMPLAHDNVTGPAAGGALSLVLGSVSSGGICRGGHTSPEHCTVRGGRALIVDELELRRESPGVFVLPDSAELWDGELAQLEQGLVEAGLLNLSGGSSSPCCMMHANCCTLVDVMDFMLELGAAVDEPQAASMLLERLQARIRRVVAAAASGGSPSRLLPSASPVAGAAPIPIPAPKRNRVLILQSLQPLVEPGRWVPEMLALAGATSCLAQRGGTDVMLSWHDVREQAAPDLLIILTSQGASGGRGGANQGSTTVFQDRLAALATQPGWWCLPAVRESQVYLMQSSYFVRPGPRLVDGVELLARLLMPGHYNNSRKVPLGEVMQLSLAAGQRCRATLLPSYFVPVAFS
ncbi:hypothetical protein Vretimale_15696 [Volvox reticuliferus]|uniref:CobB/CobQ-like glutamine amidotransferase domain-containing protein n=1 Tax=Volvox reticuliferus TaxID=1737510 RepID=A0A8J4LWF8_9CHLO|nr:hypothetical protein Vretifemale_20715 [Volvox reticuliferus]GIM12333.1 hypothetical protein Vretimale_15696 [Volvox reticuliferus]